jgi:site-specific recombinase XerC
MLSMTNFQPSGIRPVFRESNDPSNGRKLTVRKPTLAGTRPWLIERRLTPHGLRHYCASSLYTQGVGLKAIQELLGHSWLSTTTLYVHVHNEHIEQAWNKANQRVTARLIGG